jgi:glutathione/glutaredoxin type arsenate reductase
MKSIMFVCKKNSRRSQMAEAFTKVLGHNHVQVTSSGLEASTIDPLVITVMAEVGIDLSTQTSKPLSAFNSEDYDVVISLCGCGVNLPPEWVLRERFEDWQLEDPEGGTIAVFRQIRDQIQERVTALLQVLGEDLPSRVMGEIPH